MIRIILTAALFLSATVSIAQAEEIRIGAATIGANFDNGNDVPYFDTYPGSFCGVKALRVAVLDHNVGASVHIGRVYLAFQKPAAHGPFSAYAIVNANVREGETTAWIKLPKMDSCLKKVRVYAEGNSTLDWGGGSYRVVVIGAK